MEFEIAALIVLLVLSAVFSASEIAFTSLSSFQADDLAKRRPRSGGLVKRLSKHPEQLLTAILVGNNIVNITISVLATNITIASLGNEFLGITTGVLTILILIFGEVVPKQYALLNNEIICAITAPLIYGLRLILLPVIILLTALTKFVRKLSPHNPRRGISIDSLLHMVNRAEDVGVMGDFHTKVVKNAVTFNDINVRAVMTHRTEVFSLEETIGLGEAKKAILSEGYTRIPVYKGSPENITGVVKLPSLLQHMVDGTSHVSSLKSIAVPPLFVPESWNIQECFQKMRSTHNHLAIILDEYGGLMGIVTMEDLIEELVGEIYDETDTDEIEYITELAPRHYLLQGDTPIHELERAIERHIDCDEDLQTISGYITAITGEIPRQRQRVQSPIGVFRIDRVIDNKILSVRFTLS